LARGRQIGRMELRPLNEQEHARYFLHWSGKELNEHPEKFPKLTSQAIFGNDAPLEVEIGMGSGEYLLWLAQQEPQTNFLGIEVSGRAALFAAAQAAEQGADNLRVLRADFKQLYSHLEANSWQRVYLHFPDPVHKARDERRRIFDQTFLDAMARVLQPGGEISVVSDKADFFFEMLELAEGDRRFQKKHAERFLESFDPPVKSRFHRSWESKGIFPKRFILAKA
jgi:tRNA (guanine-N7-)-methyltransferase